MSGVLIIFDCSDIFCDVLVIAGVAFALTTRCVLSTKGAFLEDAHVNHNTGGPLPTLSDLISGS
jgi:hypothetical protein